MPKRTDIQRILILGSGPIVIGQACEFDYSGTQACKALKDEGYEVILINSNPATIMTDPEFAHRTYVEPLTINYVEDILRKERPQAILPTMGGQTALNLAMELNRRGTLKELGIELIGANARSIELAESREQFKKLLLGLGVDLPKSGHAKDLATAMEIIQDVGFPCIIRASFTLGGSGASIAYNVDEFQREVLAGLEASPVSEVLIEESVLGWKEYELELMRDHRDNVIIVCSIENVDPMGVHTGDSITVAPAQTLTDREYQTMRDASIRIIRAVGVDTGGSNIQFAVDPKTGRQVAIEMNPRVSRSSALASKATGFPIAKIATKLAVGYSLDELQNDITKVTSSCFEPSIDYVVTKIPRFAFDKFRNSEAKLSPSMKSVGEAMAIGRTFQESMHKALRSLEVGWWGLNPVHDRRKTRVDDEWVDSIKNYLRVAKPDRILWVAQAFREGIPAAEIAELTTMDPWFINQIGDLVDEERAMAKLAGSVAELDETTLWRWKRKGFSDRAISHWAQIPEPSVAEARKRWGIRPVYKMVDTCAAEIPSTTPYYYSTYEPHTELPKLPKSPNRKRIVILGGGPNRIGQGVEFDYCCVRASLTLRRLGHESILVNCNPETVSTDYDVSDRLFFEPLYLEDLLQLLDQVEPDGIIVHLGGQTPLNLSRRLAELGYPILGTSAEAIALAEDRDKFRELCQRLNIAQPKSAIVSDLAHAESAAQNVGFPVLVRPSFVLGGGGMEILYGPRELERWLMRSVEISADSPLLIDRFLKNAVEVDVDAVSDGEQTVICGLLEQIQEAGVHSGDSACAIPPMSLSPKTQALLVDHTARIAKAMKVRGFLNVQYAIENDQVYVLEVNPRASRTVPFCSKARGYAFCDLSVRVMLGESLRGFDIPPEPKSLVYVKEAVFPFKRFPGTDIILGPEMRSTGEVMGVGSNFGEAFGKALRGAGFTLPTGGAAFLSVKDDDKASVVPIAKELLALGFTLLATRGTCEYLHQHQVPTKSVNKVNEGRPHVVDAIKNQEIQLVINTSALGVQEAGAAYELRRATLMQEICYFTTITAARAGVKALAELQHAPVRTYCLQTTAK